jgi:glycosyltransferase involved in cell wall biosynthesis
MHMDDEGLGMLKEVKRDTECTKLNRAAWHKPLISIVITHFNYADHIEDAILSLLDQSYENWECVVVDDASSYEQHAQLVAILDRIGSTKIRLVEHSENLGQIPAFFTGLDATSGDFVCLLDPDDRYAETFLEEALACHLNETVFCPIACTEQMFLANGGIITGVNSCHNRKHMEKRGDAFIVTPQDPRILHFEAHERGWLWTSTSAMMFRRAACEIMRPNRPLAYKGCFDGYAAQGAHMLGGTLFYTKPLVYRGLHGENAYMTAKVYASAQYKKKPHADERAQECLSDAAEAILHNGGSIITKQKKTLAEKWRRSFEKRWQRLVSRPVPQPRHPSARALAISAARCRDW